MNKKKLLLSVIFLIIGVFSSFYMSNVMRTTWFVVVLVAIGMIWDSSWRKK